MLAVAGTLLMLALVLIENRLPLRTMLPVKLLAALLSWTWAPAVVPEIVSPMLPVICEAIVRMRLAVRLLVMISSGPPEVIVLPLIELAAARAGVTRMPPVAIVSAPARLIVVAAPFRRSELMVNAPAGRTGVPT